MRELRLPAVGSFEAWRKQAREFALRKVSAHEVSWRRHDAPRSLLSAPEDVLLPEGPVSPLNVPPSFIALAEEAACHSADDVHDQLYALLLRVVKEPGLMSNPADAQLAHVQALAKSVRRDCHKMKAFVRFRELPEHGLRRRRFAAWFEPDHYIMETRVGLLHAPLCRHGLVDCHSTGQPVLCCRLLDGGTDAAPRPPDHDDVETFGAPTTAASSILPASRSKPCRRRCRKSIGRTCPKQR